jgi:DNA-binding response OmpR family regulator
VSRILIVEDESRIASFLEKGLRGQGHTPTVVADGFTGLDYALTGDFDLMVLDVGLPDMDGLTVLARLRAQGSSLPVVVLTARDSVETTMAALEGGADDYMPKPFRFDELAARIRLRLRTRVTDRTDSHVLEQGPLSLDLRNRQLHVDGAQVELSAREFTLCETFLRNPGQVLTREQLLSNVWGYDFDPGSNVVDVYVGYLRKKIGAARIVTVRGMGYRLDVHGR